MTDSAVDVADSADTAVRARRAWRSRGRCRRSRASPPALARLRRRSGHAASWQRGGPHRQGGCSQARARSRGRAARGRRSTLMDEFTLSLPRERRFHGVAHLVLGGLAARLDLTFDVLDDLQLALDELLERRGRRTASSTIELRVDERQLAAVDRPVDGDRCASWSDERGRRSASAACSRRSSTASRSTSGTAGRGSSCARATSSRTESA